MFRTIGRTWALIQESWSVLQKDRELIAFPVLSLVGMALVVALFAAVAAGTGSLDHLRGTVDPVSGQRVHHFTAADGVLLVLLTVSLYFVAIFFNAALIEGAIQRLRGNDPTIGSALSATLPRAHAILGWAIISAGVGIVLSMLRNRSGLAGRMVLSLVGGVWAYMTFFVVPLLVVRGLDPISAVKESASLFRRTWGDQVVANIGFGIFYVCAVLLAFLPAALLFVLSPVLGIVVGAMAVAFAFSLVAALEGIFHAALYQYAAEGAVPPGFEGSDLATSYRIKD
jgi:hypothetical protein